MTDRDHFAAAALTGLLFHNHEPPKPALWWVEQAFDYADAMLRERAKTNHDAAPAAIAGTPGTGDTPVTKPMPKEKRAEVSDRSKPIAVEPVAWGVVYPNDEVAVIAFKRHNAEERATASDRVVPLYRHPPTLTDAEREAAERASIAYELLPTEGAQQVSATLRGLLERLGGVE